MIFWKRGGGEVGGNHMVAKCEYVQWETILSGKPLPWRGSYRKVRKIGTFQTDKMASCQAFK